MVEKYVQLCGSFVEFVLESVDPIVPDRFRIDLRGCQFNKQPFHNLVPVKATIMTGILAETETRVSSEDYFSLSSIKKLGKWLSVAPRTKVPRLELWSEENTIHLKLQTCRAGKEVSIAGDLPPRKWHYHVFRAKDPMVFRKHIKIAVSFEFRMAIERLAAPARQIEEFLDACQQFGDCG